MVRNLGLISRYFVDNMGTALIKSKCLLNYFKNISRPFLELRPVSGSMVAHPPYCEELLEASLRHMERLLQDSAEPLSFVVILPEWPDRQTHALHKLQASHFKRKQVFYLISIIYWYSTK